MKKIIIYCMFISVVGIIIGFIYGRNVVIQQNNVLGSRTYPLLEADIKAHTGGTIKADGVTLIASESTFDEDVFLRVDKIARSNPISVGNLWQVTDLWEARVKSMATGDQVNEYQTHANYILSFPYTTQYLTTDQGVSIPESSLILIRGETATGPWTILDRSILDITNKTLSVLTNRGGFFMIAGGYYTPTKMPKVQKNKSQSEIPSTPQERVVVLKQNEVVVTITPTQAYSPTTKLENTKPLLIKNQYKKKSKNNSVISIIDSMIHSLLSK